MHKLVELKEKLMNELEDYSENGKYSKDDVEAIKYITSSIDHLCNIMEEDGYSNMGDYSNRGYSRRYDDGMNYNSRYSRARGRTNARRDSMGRYSRGYSMSDDEMMKELRELMQDAPDDRTRKEFQSFIDRLERM